MTLLFLSCEKLSVPDTSPVGNTTLTFSTTTADLTRSASPASCFTKLNVQLFDADGAKVFSTVKTQLSTDPDFGTMSVQLQEGTYTVVAVGHSSLVSATIKSPDMVQFTAKDGQKLTDTFCYCGQIAVGSSPAEHSLLMHRAVAMFRLCLTDETIPESFSTMKMDYTGGSANFNPTTFEGTTKSTQSEQRPAVSPQVYQVFTFPYMSASGTLKMTLSALTADGTVITQKTLESVPVTRNRITTYTGHLFDEAQGEITQTGFGFTVDDDWEGEDNYTF